MTAKTSTRPLRWLNPWTAVALSAILAVGVAATAWVAWLADRELREDLLRQAQVVAIAVDINHVRSLTGTETDLASPDYQSLKKQFARIKVVNDKYRFIYLMGKRSDGQFFFFVDNEPPESKDYSPPGQVYDEKLEGLRRVFDTRMAVVEGPVTDRWGTWVSGLIPLIDPANGAVLAVLGMDIAAHTWAWDVAAHAALPVMLMLVLTILLMARLVTTRAAVKLQQNKDLLINTIEATADGILVVNKKGYITHSNKRFAEMWHIPSGLIEQKDDKKLLSYVIDQLEDPKAFLSKIKKLYESSEKDMDTLFFKDGRVFERFSAPLLRYSGIEGRVWSFRDITERKRAEVALSISEEKYRLVVENANDAIIIVQDGVIKFPNHQAIALSGYSEEEITSVPFSSFIHADDKDMVMEMHRKRLQGEDIPSMYSFNVFLHVHK